MAPGCQRRMKVKLGYPRPCGVLCYTQFNRLRLNAKIGDKRLRLNSLPAKPCLALCLEKIPSPVWLETVLPANILTMTSPFKIAHLEELSSLGHRSQNEEQHAARKPVPNQPRLLPSSFQKDNEVSVIWSASFLKNNLSQKKRTTE